MSIHLIASFRIVMPIPSPNLSHWRVVLSFARLLVGRGPTILRPSDVRTLTRPAPLFRLSCQHELLSANVVSQFLSSDERLDIEEQRTQRLQNHWTKLRSTYLCSIYLFPYIFDAFSKKIAAMTPCSSEGNFTHTCCRSSLHYLFD